MKVAIVGSRDYPDLEAVRRYVQLRLPRESTILVSGGAPGVDRTAEIVARLYLKFEPLILPADWDRYGKAAGPIRNTAIVEACDWLVAFLHSSSAGTCDVIGKALKARKLRAVYPPGGAP